MSEGRLQHLLQPIRDLSKNWNIDLATELEEYMDKIENLTIAFDPTNEAHLVGDHHSAGIMNFAEAALLIQGSTVIYGRKVEYLHALVYQTLAHLSKQQDDRGQKRRETDESGATQTQTQMDSDDGLSVFQNPLPLYETLDEAKTSHIQLKVPHQANKALEQGSPRSSRPSLCQSKTHIPASIALMGSMTPAERDHGETFKLLSCNLDTNGVLLLDEASKQYVEGDWNNEDNIIAERTRDNNIGDREKEVLPVSTVEFNEMEQLDEDPVVDDEPPDAMDDDAQEFLYDEPLNDETREETTHEPPVENEQVRGRSMTPVSEEKDPWMPLDAYDASTSVVRPYKKGKSYPRVPAYKKRKPQVAPLSNKENVVGVEEDAELDGLTDPAFQNRFFRALDRPQWASWVWTETSDENPLEKTCKRSFCRTPLLSKHCAVLWQREAKWRALLRRSEAREQQSAQAVLLREQAIEEEANGNDPMQMLSLSSATARLDVAFRNEDPMDEDKNEEDSAFENDLDDGDWDHGHDAEELVEAAAASGPLSYEEICRQHLASFMSGTEKYVRETDLSKQVSEWQEKLTPILKQQDAHPPFDIHHYGREIIGRLEKETTSERRLSVQTKKRGRNLDDETSVPFDTLVEGKRSFEVCRLFLASLQLANSGNVALLHAQSVAEHDHVPFQMQLLSSANTFEALQA